jgi:hypothetical protein
MLFGALRLMPAPEWDLAAPARLSQFVRFIGFSFFVSIGVNRGTSTVTLAF